MGFSFDGNGGKMLIEAESSPLYQPSSSARPISLSMKQISYFEIIGLFNLAESVYATMARNSVFPPGSEPDHFKFPLALPHSTAQAFAVVRSGRVMAIEIAHKTGETEIIPSPKY